MQSTGPMSCTLNGNKVSGTQIPFARLLLLGFALVVTLARPTLADESPVPGKEESFEANSAEASDASDDSGGSAICWRDQSGFIFSLPPDWFNDREVAGQLGLCAIGFLNGSGFHDATAVMYPQTFSAQLGQTAEAQADNAAEIAKNAFSLRPGGEAMRISPGEPLTTRNGLRAEIRLFDDGPPPTAFEAAAYILHEDVVFTVVLSSQTRQGREQAMPAFHDAVRNVIALEVQTRRLKAMSIQLAPTRK